MLHRLCGVLVAELQQIAIVFALAEKVELVSVGEQVGGLTPLCGWEGLTPPCPPLRGGSLPGAVCMGLFVIVQESFGEGLELQFLKQGH